MTPGGASPFALLGSNFDEGSGPFSTLKDSGRRPAGAAVDAGGANVDAFRSFSVPSFAPFAVAG